MKVLVLAPQPFFAERGTPIAVRSLVEVLSDGGHRVDLLTYQEGEDIDLDGVRHLRSAGGPGLGNIPPGFSLKKVVADAPFFARAARLLVREEYDLIHAVEEAAFMALLLRRVSGIPYVYDMDSSIPEQLLSRFEAPGSVVGMMRSAETAAIRGSIAVLAVCEHLESRALEVTDSSHIVGTVEDYSLLRNGDNEVDDLEATIGSSGPIVLYVGNLQSYQGLDLLIDAFGFALDDCPAAQLVIIGGTAPNIEKYHAHAATRGLADHVHLIGPRPLEHLGGYLRQATALVSPRISGTNTPMKLYSYLASGVPIVATRLEAHTQVLDDDVSVLVAAEPEPYGRAIGRLLRDRQLRERIGRRAAEYAEQEYSREAFERKVRSFYRRVEERVSEE